MIIESLWDYCCAWLKMRNREERCSQNDDVGHDSWRETAVNLKNESLTGQRRSSSQNYPIPSTVTNRTKLALTF